MSDNPNWRDRSWDSQSSTQSSWGQQSLRDRKWSQPVASDRLDRHDEQTVGWSITRGERPTRSTNIDECRSKPVRVIHRDIGYGLLQLKSRASAQEAVMFCYQTTFSKLLSNESLSFDWIQVILVIISNALRADTSLHSVRQSLKDKLLHEPFLGQTCKESFSGKLTLDIIESDELVKPLTDYLDIFHLLCAMDPIVCKQLVKPVTLIKQLLKGVVIDNEIFRGIYDLYSQATSEIERQEKEKDKLERRMKELSKTGRMETDDKPSEDFRDIPIYPVKEDLTAVVRLRVNQVNNAYDSVDDYLDIQFRLLREDFVATFRQGIQEFKKHSRLSGPNRFRSGDIKIYQKLSINTPIFDQSGLNYTLRLDTDSRMFQKTNWESSQRLKHGSLLCLSQDEFKDIILFALIVERKNDVLNRDGELQIQFLPQSQTVFFKLFRQSSNKCFIAAESTAYYEPYKHVLKGMQNLSEHGLPFIKHIIRTETVLSPPNYTNERTSYRFHTADGSLTAPVPIYSELENGWPTADELGFNESQYEAYKMALTKEFVVIQGPPGTGKTFIGLKIVETLLYNLYQVSRKLTRGFDREMTDYFSERNKSNTSSLCPDKHLNQMLVVCYTNHALDQFLEGMLRFCPVSDVVRVGSRSKSELLSSCNYKKRDRMGKRSKQLSIAFQEYNEKKEDFFESKQINDLNRQNRDVSTGILPIDTPGLLYCYPEFHSQLVAFEQELDKKGINLKNSMASWLELDIEEKVRKNFLAKESYSNPTQTSNSTGDFSSSDEQSEGEDWQTKIYKRTVDEFNSDIKKEVSSSDIMSEAEFLKLRAEVTKAKIDITKDLPLTKKWRLYRYFLTQYQGNIASSIERLQTEYKQLTDEYESLKMQEDIEALNTAKVIGMTTTGAARLQSVLQRVSPEVIIVEEAAEVLESHIITALSKGCKHLILIGDHKQLKPSATVYALAKDYHLDLSLFERMVNKGLPVKTLNIQHRMRPEISKYIRGHIYERLDDHNSVFDRDPIEGVKCPVFFFNHNNPEATDEATMSHSNQFEAEMVVEFTSYLLKQKSYEPKDITIITMYTGQLLLIKRLMPRSEGNGVKVTSVDNFQGEENKIVIISLVRSNLEGSLGFVKIENRVCVCMSRAQCGMYLFGDFDMLARGSTLWRDIVKDAKEAGEIGSQLNLSCQVHNNPTIIEKPPDFKNKVPEGGCQLTCNVELACGHRCELSCHTRDLNHEEYKCSKPCSRLLSPCDHPCTAVCHLKCPPCLVRSTKTLDCGHTCNIPCHQLNSPTSCIEPCADSLDCGHACTARCGQPCTTSCTVVVKQICLICNKWNDVPCHSKDENQCDRPCEISLACGHKCAGTCYQCYNTSHQECKERCDKILTCGHRCSDRCKSCAERGDCSSCTSDCSLLCSHGSKCTKKCSEDCLFTIHTTDLTCQWGCMHSKCERECGEPCSFIPCDKSCDKMVACAQCNQEYPCVGLCGEPCPPLCPQCDQPKLLEKLEEELGSIVDSISVATKWIVLEDCKHLVPEAFINKLDFGGSTPTLITCPFSSCGVRLLNTPRYALRTRPVKAVSHVIDIPKIADDQKMQDEKLPTAEVVNVDHVLQPKVSRSRSSATKHRPRREKRGPPPPPPWMVIPEAQENLRKEFSEDQRKQMESADLVEPSGDLSDHPEPFDSTEMSVSWMELQEMWNRESFSRTLSMESLDLVDSSVFS